jgi:hypothetical protein
LPKASARFGSIQTKNGLAPFRGLCNFIPHAEAGVCYFGDKVISISQPIQIAIVNLTIADVLTQHTKLGIGNMLSQNFAVFLQ